MKFFTFLSCLLFLSAFCSAQPVASTHNRKVGKIGNLDSNEFFLRKEKKANELHELTSLYHQTADSKRSEIRAQMLVVLYELFDLNMIEQYSEAQELKGLLNQVEKHENYQQNNSEINKLKLQLKQIENQISKRKSHRDNIVSKRLQTLISQK
ncbi:MAG: hypothetical protein MRZ79_03395 [Bacteroidia bacterium]|nr:hypothetical protein [Bacteroidia bacterium]